jgi:hypothetical protein
MASFIFCTALAEFSKPGAQSVDGDSARSHRYEVVSARLSQIAQTASSPPHVKPQSSAVLPAAAAPQPPYKSSAFVYVCFCCGCRDSDNDLDASSSSAVAYLVDFFLSMKRKEPQALPASSDVFVPSSYQALSRMQQQSHSSHQAPFSSADNGVILHPPAEQRPQAYAARSQSFGSGHNYRRNSRDGDSTAAVADAGQAEGGRGSRSSSRGSAEVGVVDGDARFISSLLSAQQARMRVYV